MRTLLYFTFLGIYCAGCEKNNPIADSGYEFSKYAMISGDTTICSPFILDFDNVMEIQINPKYLTGLADTIRIYQFDGFMHERFVFYDWQAADIYQWDIGNSSKLSICRRWPTYDSLVVNFRNCDYRITFPEAFTPNGDGQNDGWKPFWTGCENVVWEIRSPHGELVFDQNGNQDISWNGGWDGEAAPNGLYQYFCTYHTNHDEDKEAGGWIELYR